MLLNKIEITIQIMKIIRTMELLYKTSATISEKCEIIKWFKTSGILYIISKSLTGI